MKSILLASASIVAFAGAAAAEISFSGSATLGYNDTADGDNDGFYDDLDLTISFSQELDNGLTVAASIDLDDISADDGAESDDYELSLTHEMGGLFYGDTDAAIDATYGLQGAFDASDDADFGALSDVVLRGDITFGDVDASVSYANVDDELEGLQIAAVAGFGNVDVRFGFADEDHGFDGGLIMLGASTTVGGAEVYADLAFDDNNDGYQVGVSYPAGPVTVGAYYGEFADAEFYGVDVDYADGPVSVSASFDSADGEESWSLDGSYDVGNGLVVYAGVADEGDDFYVAGEYDLGGGAAFLVSYGEDDDLSAGDEIGDPEYQNGTTVELSFEF